MTTVASLLERTGLEAARAVRWGEPPVVDGPGVYVISQSPDPGATGTNDVAPISSGMVRQLLDARPELTVDRRRPSTDELVQRLSQLWLPGEPIVYIGLAGTSVQQRLRQYYRTRIGARAPHAGGWPIKMLSTLDDLWVHAVSTPEPNAMEIRLIELFAAGAVVPSDYCDLSCVLPYANLTTPGGRRQQHGIAGARAPKEPGATVRESPNPKPTAAPTIRTRASTGTPGASQTQRVTQKDIEGGRIRVPNTAKSRFPPERVTIQVDLCGQRIEARWDPKDGPDERRSGVISIPRHVLASLVRAESQLTIRTDGRTISLS